MFNEMQLKKWHSHAETKIYEGPLKITWSKWTPFQESIMEELMCIPSSLNIILLLSNRLFLD